MNQQHCEIVSINPIKEYGLNHFKKGSFVAKWTDGKYESFAEFTVKGKGCEDIMKFINVGDHVVVNYVLSGRMGTGGYEGRCWNEITAFRVSRENVVEHSHADAARGNENVPF